MIKRKEDGSLMLKADMPWFYDSFGKLNDQFIDDEMFFNGINFYKLDEDEIIIDHNHDLVYLLNKDTMWEDYDGFKNSLENENLVCLLPLSERMAAIIKKRILKD